MKQGIAALILIVLFFTTTALGEGPGKLIPYPYDRNLAYQQEAASYRNYIKKTWKIYNVTAAGLDIITRNTKFEYRSSELYSVVKIGFDRSRPCIKTKIQLFNKPIFLEFSFSS